VVGTGPTYSQTLGTKENIIKLDHQAHAIIPNHRRGIINKHQSESVHIADEGKAPTDAARNPPSESNQQSALKVLLRGDERFRLLVESAQDYAIFFMDVEGRVVDWNIGAERILGYTEEEIIGQLGAIIFTPEDREQKAPEREVEKARTEGRAENERWHVRKDGSRFWGSGINMPLRDESGNLLGYAKVMRDFTARRQADQEKAELLQREQDAKKEAEAAKRAKDHFIAVAAHELRSPMTSVLGWVDLLLKGGLDAETQQGALEAIRRNAHSQNQIISDLLDASRITSGRIHLETAPLDLLSLVTTAIEDVRPTAEGKSIQIDLVVNTGIEPVLGDANRLHQVMLNLLGNAVKFTPEGGHIEVRLERQGEQNLIQVKDTGIGISPEFLPHIFDPYQQSSRSSSREHKGLGLGLSIVRQLVTMHGGSVRAESDGEGRGATFTVRLPIHPAGSPQGEGGL
jgi:PAS domain S-box-containing protein